MLLQGSISLAQRLVTETAVTALKLLGATAREVKHVCGLVFWLVALYANIWVAALAVLALPSWIALGMLMFQVLLRAGSACWHPLLTLTSNHMSCRLTKTATSLPALLGMIQETPQWHWLVQNQGALILLPLGDVPPKWAARILRFSISSAVKFFPMRLIMEDEAALQKGLGKYIVGEDTAALCHGV